MIKYSVIGTSPITEEFIAGAKTVEGLELFGVYSRTYSKGKALSEKTGAKRIFIDLRDLLRCCDFQAVYVASPNSLHYEQTKLLLESGKHVLCEKPITVTSAQLKELQALADKNNLVYMEGIMYMHSPVRGKIIEALPLLGNIHSAHFDFSQLSSKLPAYKRGENPNIFNPEFATGSLMDLGVYCVYPVLDIFGLPKTVSARSTFMESGADGCGSAIFGYDDKTVSLTWSKLAQSFSPSEIRGDEGTLTIGSISQLNEVYVCRKGMGSARVSGTTEKHLIMAYEAADFLSFITDPEGTKEKYECCKLRALQVSQVMEYMRKVCGIRFKEDKNE